MFSTSLSLVGSRVFIYRPCFDRRRPSWASAFPAASPREAPLGPWGGWPQDTSSAFLNPFKIPFFIMLPVWYFCLIRWDPLHRSLSSVPAANTGEGIRQRGRAVSPSRGSTFLRERLELQVVAAPPWQEGPWPWPLRPCLVSVVPRAQRHLCRCRWQVKGWRPGGRSLSMPARHPSPPRPEEWRLLACSRKSPPAWPGAGRRPCSAHGAHAVSPEPGSGPVWSSGSPEMSWFSQAGPCTGSGYRGQRVGTGH